MKKHQTSVFILSFLFLIFILNSCETEPAGPSSVDSYQIISSQKTTAFTTSSVPYMNIELPNESYDEIVLDYQFNNQTDATKDLYFVFSNGSAGDSSQNPTVTSNSLIADFNHIPSAVNEFNNHPPELLKKDSFRGTFYSLISEPSIPSFSTVGEDELIYHQPYENDNSQINARCVRKVTVGTLSVSIYVPYDQLSPAFPGGTGTVTQTDIDILADNFLKAGDNNDVYDWVTSIFGKEWGTHTYSNLIGGQNEITILLYDIPIANVLGFYWSKDQFTNVSNSNKRLMFYLDSVYYMNPANRPPMLSTLAHEFQHMVHFYQKQILQSGKPSETWLNEMCSLITEDLVSWHLQVKGPRGVAWDDPTAGAEKDTTDDRIFKYNLNSGNSVFSFPQGMDIPYHLNYSYGSFLLRNYTGNNKIQFARDIVQNAYTDYRAINQALIKAGYPDRFADTIQNWGFSVLLSDNTTAEFPVANNRGNWLSLSDTGYHFQLGSINYYNYIPDPKTYTIEESNTIFIKKMYGASNRFVHIGETPPGSRRFKIRMNSGIRMGIVIK